MRWPTSALLSGSVLSGLLTEGAAVPTSSRPVFDDFAVDSTHPFADFGTDVSPRVDKVPLRILSLGASIMSGVGSSTGNGLRKPLRDALRFDGWDVDMVGSLSSGTMVDNDHEAVPGDVLTQIRARLQHSLGYKANIVIINGGTNDANRNVDTGNAGSRMEDILNDIWGAEGMAGTCIMLSTLLDTSDTTGAVQRITINDQYRNLVTKRAGDGKCIYLADMDPPSPSPGHGWINTWDDYYSGENPHVHPNDEGHRKMAYVFYKAINKAIKDGKLLAPGEFAASDPVCDKFAGTGIYPGGLTQRGIGADDGIYYHDSEEMGIVWSADSDWDRDQWRFARLFSPKYDDFLAWIKDSDSVNIRAAH